MSLINTKGLKELSDLFLRLIKGQLSDTSFSWLEEKVRLIQQEDKAVQLSMTFAQLPRFVPRTTIKVEPETSATIAHLLSGLKVSDWSLERLCRVWLLLQVPATEQDTYYRKINGLFTAAEMNEQIALYSTLPLFAYPELWIGRCEEGIRSNIGTVLEAIMYHNPYPAAYLSEPSWNQLVLKAFFTEKNVKLIAGLYERLNKSLSDTLEDYVQERLAAHRNVLPEIYELIERTKEKI